MGQTSVVKNLLARSVYNAEKSAEDTRKAKEEAGAEDPKSVERVRMSSEDDWSSEESVYARPARNAPTDAEMYADSLESDKEEPDILDVSAPDWDFGLTALGYAILFGFVEVVAVLLAAGADPNTATRVKGTNPLHALTLTTYTQDEERALKIAENLVAGQATSSTADRFRLTIFHRIVIAKKTKIVASLLARDQNAKKVLDIPAHSRYEIVFPVVSSILSGDYATLSVLLSHGAKLAYSPEDISRAQGVPQPWSPPRVHLPVEVALVRRDDVVSLLAALGAAVDMPVHLSHQPSVSLIQWTSLVLKELLERTRRAPSPPVESKPTKELPTSPTGDTWAEYRAYLTAVLPKKEPMKSVTTQEAPSSWHEPVSPGRPYENHTSATTEYYARAESILRSYSAEPHQVPQSDKAPTVKAPSVPPFLDPQVSGYVRPGKDRVSIPIPVHLKVLYAELYEACWTGDNESIQELCLPKHLSEDKEPIHIFVQTTNYKWTPFFVAVHRRHWETARLVIAIATAQYQPPDDEATPFIPTSSVLSGYDSDEGSYDSDEEDDRSYEQEIDFTDLAARPSAVRAEASAKRMVQLDQSVLLEPDGKRGYCDMLQKAIREDDFEAFVRTLELYEFAGVAIWPDAAVHELAVALDRPDMVDEIIRRTGIGIPYTTPSETAESRHQSLMKAVEEKRVYLGLKVSGKWRAGAKLYMQAQSGPDVITYNYDLLRGAIFHGATKVIEYLTGPRPLAAYTYYAATHSDDPAQYLKGFENLGAVLPGLLGWKLDELNESPLLCAVVHDKIDILKQLFALKPDLMEEALYQRTKFVGFNALLAAAYRCSSTEIVDFLLEKGCDPSESDAHDSNIYHVACRSPNPKRVKFVKHLLKALSNELTHELMAQTCTGISNTPLMVAVKLGHIMTIRAILDFGINPTIFLCKDADGSTPLDIAVRKTNTILAELLLQYGPTEQLYIENSVGQTPLELAGLKFLPRVMGSIEAPRPKAPDVSPSSQAHSLISERTAPFDVERQKVEIPKLRSTLDALVADGHLVYGTKLATELFAFAARMEEKLAIEVARKDAAKKDSDLKEEDADVASYGTTAGMYTLLRDQTAVRPGHRHPVHLTVVQQSVQRSLAAQQDWMAAITWSRVTWKWKFDEEEPDPEEERIARLRRRSLLKYACADVSTHLR